MKEPGGVDVVDCKQIVSGLAVFVAGCLVLWWMKRTGFAG